MNPYFTDSTGRIKLYHGDCREIVPTIGKVQLIATDPPYNGVLDAGWDNSWEDDEHFLSWIRELSIDWQKALTANGSIYCFAWPIMAARLEMVLRERFTILASIVWKRPNSRGGLCEKATLRSFFPETERIIFGEIPNSDGVARGTAGYIGACDDARGDIFEPIRAYLDGERERAGFTRQQCNDICGNQMAGHYFSQSQWTLPTRENYDKLQKAFNAPGVVRPALPPSSDPLVHEPTPDQKLLDKPYEYLRKDFEFLQRDYEFMKTKYDDLKLEYERLRRPFFLKDGMQWSDVWDFKTEAGAERTGHPCQKPLAMMQHMIACSTNRDDVVLDPFAGSGTTLRAAKDLGRQAIGIEIEEKNCEMAAKRLQQEAFAFF